ncbi:MAG: oxidoreductase [Dehalococcoidia bacterium]|nr:oxidoreductase [Dehalococcoidia bacterium]
MQGFPPVKVLVCTSLSDAQLRRIRDASSRIEVSDGAALLLEELPEALRPGQSQPPLRDGRSFQDLLASAEVMLAARRVPHDLAERAPRLRWIQMPLVGLNGVGLEGMWKRAEVAITSAAGVNALPVAEYAIMAMMMLVKDARRILASQESRLWDRYDLGQLRGKTLAIIGFGMVGKEVARLAEPFGVRLLGLKRQVDEKEGLPTWVYPADRLHDVLGQADIVVLCLPATRATRGMIGREQLALLRRSAIVINVSRGDVIDEAAFAEALAQGRLGGAALDVFNDEPLPRNSPFWTLPGTIISGHVAGLFQGLDDAIVDLFLTNLERYLSGRALINAVDRQTGY